MRTRPSSSPSNPMPSAPKREVHQSVLLQESILALSIKKSDTVVDATLGGAGHALSIAKQLGPKGTLVGFDLDAAAITRAEKALAQANCKTLFIEANFRALEKELTERGITSIDSALFDLGWSSFQLEVNRGFSFKKDEPLLMTYTMNSDSAAITAAIIVNEWEESSIADILFGWGEERYSRRIAKAIVERRDSRLFETSSDLAEVIKSTVPRAYAFGRIHPATRAFQALRIAVNDELGALEVGLKSCFSLLNPGGRIAVISFHSIEDRVVKRHFRELEERGLAKRITKKPLTPASDELQHNPRSRSAKLRILEKL